ncbi:MAG: LysR family transcriptional regulator [Pseudomonadota bacterium]
MDWEDLKIFIAISRHGTVRRAAEELGIHHATVARRVARLEESLGVRLFDRRPEGLSLTPPGEELLTVGEAATVDFDAVIRRISGQDTAISGSVVVSTGEPVAIQLIAPGLPEFADRYPDLDLKIVTSWNIADLARGEADIAVRADNNPADSLFGKRLFPYFEAIYGEAEYLRTLGTSSPDQPGRWIGWGGSDRPRPSWVEKTQYASTRVWGGFESLSLQVAAAEAGLGLIALPCFIGDRAKGLIRAPDAEPKLARQLWLLTHADLRRTRRIRVVMEFLEDRLRRNRDLIEGRRPGTP